LLNLWAGLPRSNAVTLSWSADKVRDRSRGRAAFGWHWAIAAWNGNLGVLLVASSAAHLLRRRLVLWSKVLAWLLLAPLRSALRRRGLTGSHTATHLRGRGRALLRLIGLEDWVHERSKGATKRVSLLLLRRLHSIHAVLAVGRLLRSANRRLRESWHRRWALRCLRGHFVGILPTKLEERLLLLLNGRGDRHRWWLRALEQLRKGALFLGRRHGRCRGTHAVGRLLARWGGSGSPSRLLRYSRHLRDLRHL
jgi:hypothetical protein